MMGVRRTYGTRPQVDAILDLAVFKPTAAFFLPDSGLVELVEMRVDIVQRFLLHVDGLDGFGLDLLHHLYRVLDRRFNGGEEGAARPCCARSLQR